MRENSRTSGDHLQVLTTDGTLPIGANDLNLHFDDDVTILVTSCISCASSDGMEHKNVDFRKAAPDLMVFLDRTIVKAEGSEDGTLRLIFDTGATLTIYDDSKQYESYVIRHGENVIVV